MTTTKVSLTLEASSILRAREVAGGSLSSYVDEALAEKLERDGQRAALLVYLDELEANDPTPERVKLRASQRAARIREAARQ